MARNGVHNNSHSSSSSHNASSGSHSSRNSPTAQQAREEAKRKAEIQAQIDTRNGQIGQLNGIISELQSERTDITNSIQKRMNAKEAFGQEDITYMGEIKNIFEGEAAKSIKQQNDSKVILMDGKMRSAIAIKDSISGQESRVRTKISTLSIEIANLRSQL